EHLPYKEGVTGSSPVTTTTFLSKKARSPLHSGLFRFCRSRVSGSKQNHEALETLILPAGFVDGFVAGFWV
ncbi:MAG: hypothetical protein RR761_19640, partial [Aeromonas sp.]|uniref:hypothetical protein n=1 Tax=Aeromonas sp. TaxID=647 RepID=UPI002FCA8B6F